MTLKFASILALVAIAMVGCSSGGGGDDAKPKRTIKPDTAPDVNIPSKPNNLDFSTTTPGDQRNAFNEAVSSLYLMKLSAYDYNVSNLAQTMKLEDTTPAGLQTWMQARVQYIVDGNFDFDQNASLGSSYSYQEPNVLPDIFADGTLTPRVVPNDDGDSQVVMSNVGTALYLQGKMSQRLVSLNIPGVGAVSMTSPRTGVLKVGPGMFPDVGGAHFQNIMWDIYRLATLFHEARHSDGHGHSLGFVHNNCVDGDYVGQPACDLSTNGPYTVGASMMKVLWSSCESNSLCSPRSSEILQMLYLDQSGRTLSATKYRGRTSTDAQAGATWDDAPEGVR